MDKLTKHGTWILFGLLILLIISQQKRQAFVGSSICMSDGGPCYVTVGLPQNKSFITATYTLSFLPTDGSVFSNPITVSPVDNWQIDETKIYADSTQTWHHDIYLYALPPEWTDLSRLLVSITGTGTTTDSNASLIMELGEPAIPYSDTIIQKCDHTPDTSCPSNILFWTLNTPNGTQFHKQNYRSKVIFSSQNSTTFNMNYSFENHPGLQELFNPASNMKFLVSYIGLDDTKLGTHQPVFTRPPSVTVRAAFPQYPSDLILTTGSDGHVYLQTLPGTHTAPITTSNYATMFNLVCGRDTGNQDACEVRIFVTNPTGGTIRFTENATYGDVVPTNCTSNWSQGTWSNPTNACGIQTWTDLSACSPDLAFYRNCDNNINCTPHWVIQGCLAVDTNQCGISTGMPTTMGCQPNSTVCGAPSCTSNITCGNRSIEMPTDTGSCGSTPNSSYLTLLEYYLKRIPTWLYVIVGGGVAYWIYRRSKRKR